MGQKLSVPGNFGGSVGHPRERKSSNKSIELDTLSPVAHPQDAELATERAPESSEQGVKRSRKLHTGNKCLHHNKRPHNLPPPPADTRVSRTRSCPRRRPFSSGEEMPMIRLKRMTKVADVKRKQVGLPDLPTEIILIIAHYLPPSSLLSLSYTCQVIRNKMGVSIEHSLGKKDNKMQLSRSAFGTNLPYLIGVTGRDLRWSLPTMVPNVHRSERLELLRMLDRDGKLPPSKAVCSGCADTHDRSLFSSESLAQPSNERRCLGSAGRLWICPHWILDHNLVTTSAEPRGSHMCGKRWVSVLAVPGEFAEPAVIWPIAVLRRNNDAPPSKKLVDDLLARTDLSVCKHLRFADSFVSRLYSPDCKRLWAGRSDPRCGCSTCVRQSPPPDLAAHPDVIQNGKCESCGTRIHFFISPDIYRRETLHLAVKRNVTGFRGCTDPAWIERVNGPGEFEELERRWWKATDEEVGTVQEVSLDNGSDGRDGSQVPSTVDAFAYLSNLMGDQRSSSSS